MSRHRHYELCNLHVNGRHCHTGRVTGIEPCSTEWTVLLHAGQVSILVSHAGADRTWAQWIAFELGAAGHEVHLIVAEVDFATRITEALSGPDRVIVLFSAEHPGTRTDWARLSDLAAARLIALRLDPAAPPAGLAWRGLHGLDEEETVEVLMAAVGGPLRHPGGWNGGDRGLDAAPGW